MSYVALMRGINVGGKNLLPMKTLIAMFAEAGCSDVSSYIQSGNIVFHARPALVPKLPRIIEAHIKEKLGLSVPVIVRSRNELATIAGNNPFLKKNVDVSKLFVMFLADVPAASAVRALDPARSPGDEILVRGTEIYLYCANGFGKTKLTNAYFDAKLKTVSTARNWRTVLKLLELAPE